MVHPHENLKLYQIHSKESVYLSLKNTYLGNNYRKVPFSTYKYRIILSTITALPRAYIRTYRLKAPSIHRVGEHFVTFTSSTYVFWLD
jgi:hypothetical protein